MIFKRCFFLFLTFLIATSSIAYAKIGVGIQVGDPTGLTAKYFTKRTRAFNLGVSYSFTEFIVVYLDHQWVFWGSLRKHGKELRNLHPYLGFGVGATFATEADPDAGDSKATGFVRIPFGVEWRNYSPDIGIFAELAPGINVAPKIFGILQGGVGIRFYF